MIYPKEQKVLFLRLAPPIYKTNDHPIGFRPPYVLKYVEALLREKGGYLTKCIDQRITILNDDEIKNITLHWQPHIIVFDVSILNVTISNEFCQSLKNNVNCRNIITFATGQEVSANLKKFQDKYLQYDVVLAGEAELKVFQIIEKIKNNIKIEKIKPALFIKGVENKDFIVQQEDLDKLPMLHFTPEELQGYVFIYPLRIAKKLVWGHLITSRGCPYPCTFCTQLIREGYGTKVRVRSAAKVVDEMEHLVSQGASIITFDDENFTPSRKHVSAVCNEILDRKLKIPWIAHARVDEVDKSLLKLMSKAGCVLIRCGMETGNKRILRVLKKTFQTEEEWFKKSFEAVHYAHKYKIAVACLFMVGSPTETFEEVQESITFAKKLKPDIIQVSYFTLFPGTAVYDKYKDQLKGLNIEEFYHYDLPGINVSGMSDEQLNKAQGLFYKEFLLHPAWMTKHFFNHFLFYICNFRIFLKLLRAGNIIKSSW